MGRSMSWGLAPFVSCALLAQTPVVRDAAHKAPATPPADVVLAGSEPQLRLADFGLGDGGLGTEAPGRMRWLEDGCVTTGGVAIACRTAGVKLTFPSGRELLVAPDGFVHLRSGERAGPFPMGLELWLADGQTVRISLAPGSGERLRDVVVGDREQRVQPWRRGAPANELARETAWAGLRVFCLGDGGDLFRAVALGPLLVLDRALTAADRAATVPEQRLVLLTTPLAQSLRTMQRQHREPDAPVRQAMKGIAELAQRADQLFPAGAELARAEHDRLRWLLRGGFELELDLQGPLAPRLGLFAGRDRAPVVEWTLRADAAAFLGNPREDQAEKRWHGNGTRLLRVVPELQAKDELFERPLALRVLARLLR